MSLVCHYYNDCKPFGVVNTTKIQMPKKKNIDENITQPIEIKRTLSYELNNKSECFDPTFTGSPSNIFVNNLKNRMDDYYSDARLTMMHCRERANSIEMFIRKHA
jgi:stringent starvation protein B